MPQGWSTEDIPDEAVLYRRIHRSYCLDGELTAGAFRFKDGRMSVNWAKYASAEKTQREAPAPAQNGIVQMVCGEVRHQPPELKVEHTPLATNQAHSDVLGENDEEIRLKLYRLALKMGGLILRWHD